MKTIEELHKTFYELDKKWEQAELDFQKLQQFSEELDQMLYNLQELENYYHTQWLNERETFLKNSPNIHYQTLGEDTIWNLSSDFNQEKVRLLKKLINSI